MKHLFKTATLTLLVVSFIFSSCKKPECDTCPPNPLSNTNKPPIAVAGADQVTTLPMDSVLLDGSASNDPEGSITTWQWNKVSGPSSFTIANTGIARTQVNNLAEGTYLFELKVTDAGGLFDRDTMQVIVDDPNVNQPPVANAGADTTITLPANTVMLDGSSSADPNNNITSFQWTKISGPVSSMIMNASGAITTVSSLTAGIYLFELKVTDAGGLFDRDTIQITALSPTFTGSGIYIAGWGTNASGKKVARIWRENVLQDLSDGQYDAYALSVFVSGTDIYVAGSEINASGKSVAKLWKNGVSQNLSNGQTSAEAHSVFLSGNDVYVAGWENNTSGVTIARLWKNGTLQNLGNGQQSASAFSVFVSGNDVYAAGYVDDRAVIWKNGVVQQLSPVGEGDVAHSVFVSGNDVYAAGGSYNCCPSSGPELWINGGAQNLGTTGNGNEVGSANAVFVSGSDVYVAGWGNGSGVTLWKNGVAQSLGTAGVGAREAKGVFVSASNVYVVGYEYESIGSEYVAKLWNNAVEYSLSGLAQANSIFVQ